MKGFLHVMVLGLMLLCSCRSTRSVSKGTELATDTAAIVRQQQWQTSVIDSVWRHTELSFDSCFVIFDSGAQATPFIENHVAQPDTFIRPKARVFASMAHTFRVIERSAPRLKLPWKTPSLSLGSLSYARRKVLLRRLSRLGFLSSFA